jgi:hypothetical protein
MADGTLSSLCQSCGACCAFSEDWPRFSTDADEDLALIPAALIKPDQSGMLCQGRRCVALVGDIGVATRCAIYGLRPDVCRACQPGDDACLMARAAYGFDPVARPEPVDGA